MYEDLIKLLMLRKTVENRFPDPMSPYNYSFIYRHGEKQLSLTYSFIDIRDDFNKCVEKTVELISSKIYNECVKCKFFWKETNPGSFTRNATVEFYLDETQ